MLRSKLLSLLIFLAGAALAVHLWLHGASDARRLTLLVEAGEVDLANQLSHAWDRVCFLPPYTNHSRAREITGHGIDVYGRSSIASSDSINLLVTLQGNEVTGLFEVSMGNVDFARQGGECLPRHEARFSVPPEGHPHAQPIGSAPQTLGESRHIGAWLVC